MPRLEEPRRPWTLASINEWASDEFPDAFKAANTATTHIKFEDLADGAEFHNIVGNAPFKRPEVVDKILQVGHASPLELYFKIYVFICGGNRNIIHFMFTWDKPDCFVKLSFPHHWTRIRTEYPFSHCNETDTLSTARRKLRAFIVYLFVARGLLNEVEYFSAFPNEFKSACEWILHNPGTPQSQQNTSLGTKQTNRILASHKDPQDDEEVFSNAVKLEGLSNYHSRPLKRRQDGDSDESDRIQRRRVKEPNFSNLQEQIADKYADVQKTKDRLFTENAMIAQKRNAFEQQLTQRNEELRTAREENVALTTKNQQLESQLKNLKEKVSDAVAAVTAVVSEALANLPKG